MTSGIFPDVNVWIALSVTRHVHHEAARSWFERLETGTRLWFCRLTQIGMLRLLTQEAAMGRGAAQSQIQAWQTYDRWVGSPAVTFMHEPAAVELHFRQWACADAPRPQRWADDYLIAFAAAAGLQLATFDRGLSRRAEGAILIA